MYYCSPLCLTIISVNPSISSATPGTSLLLASYVPPGALREDSDALSGRGVAHRALGLS